MAGLPFSRNLEETKMKKFNTVLAASALAVVASASAQADTAYTLSYSYISTGVLGGSISAGTGEIHSFGEQGDYPLLPGGLYVYDENPELPNAKTGLGGNVTEVFSTGSMYITDGGGASVTLDALSYQNRIVIDDFWTNDATLGLTGGAIDIGGGTTVIGGDGTDGMGNPSGLPDLGGVWTAGGNLYCTDPIGGACAGLPGAVNGVAPIAPFPGALPLMFSNLLVGGTAVLDLPLSIPTSNGILDNSTMYVITITSVTDIPGVPVPAAAWLFGSALIGLAGIGRKRRA
jgi:hypothetical protein